MGTGVFSRIESSSLKIDYKNQHITFDSDVFVSTLISILTESP